MLDFFYFVFAQQKKNLSCGFDVNFIVWVISITIYCIYWFALPPPELVVESWLFCLFWECFNKCIGVSVIVIPFNYDFDNGQLASVANIGTQTVGGRTSMSAAAVRGVSQYKYSSGVRNMQQVIAMPGQTTIQQVGRNLVDSPMYVVLFRLVLNAFISSLC